MNNRSGSSSSIRELYQIANVRSLDVFYPYCDVCYKKLTANSRNIFVCFSCNEKFYEAKYRYKMCFDLTNLSKAVNASLFGKNLETIFGVECNKFVKFKGSLGQAENWNECLKMAFRFCLIDRWFEFEFDAAKKPSSSSSLSSSIVGKQMSIPSMEKSNFVSIYEFLMSTRHFLENLNFSSISATDLTELDSNDDQHNSSTTLINETIAPTQNSQIDEDDEDSILLNSLKSFSL